MSLSAVQTKKTKQQAEWLKTLADVDTAPNSSARLLRSEVLWCYVQETTCLYGAHSGLKPASQGGAGRPRCRQDEKTEITGLPGFATTQLPVRSHAVARSRTRLRCTKSKRWAMS